MQLPTIAKPGLARASPTTQETPTDPSSAEDYNSRSDQAPASESTAAASPISQGLLYDPEWIATHQALQGFNTRLATACARDPLEYRIIATAAVRMAAQPDDFGVNPQQAANFLNRMMA